MRRSPTFTPLPPVPHVDETTRDRRRRRHRRRNEVGAAPVALAALEIAVRGRGATLARRELVGIHGETHRTAGLTPLEAGGEENLVETLGLGLRFHQARSR